MLEVQSIAVVLEVSAVVVKFVCLRQLIELLGVMDV